MSPEERCRPPPLCTRNARGLPVDVHTRGVKPVLTGYAAVFYNPSDPGTEYRMYSDVVERIMPGAFDKTLRNGDIRALFNHRDDNILGRTTAGTLRVWTDARGLKYEIDPPDTTAGRDVVESIRRGDVTGSSFMFRPVANTYRDVDGLYIVERNEVELFDVGPVTFPAYTATDAGVRADSRGAVPAGVRAAVAHWLDAVKRIEAFRRMVEDIQPRGVGSNTFSPFNGQVPLSLADRGAFAEFARELIHDGHTDAGTINAAFSNLI